MIYSTYGVIAPTHAWTQAGIIECPPDGRSVWSSRVIPSATNLVVAIGLVLWFDILALTQVEQVVFQIAHSRVGRSTSQTRLGTVAILAFSITASDLARLETASWLNLDLDRQIVRIDRAIDVRCLACALGLVFLTAYRLLAVAVASIGVGAYIVL